MWLRAPINRVVKNNSEFSKKVLNFRIVDEKGDEIDYILIPGTPLKYRRSIEINGKATTESFEYIDGTFELEFIVKTKYPTEFVKALALAGKIGLLSRTSYGYGKFKIEVLG